MVVHLQPHFLSRTSPCGFQTRRTECKMHSQCHRPRSVLQLPPPWKKLALIILTLLSAYVWVWYIKKILSEISSTYVWSFKGNQKSEAKNELNSKIQRYEHNFFPDQTIAVYSSYHGQIIMVEHHKKSPSILIYFVFWKKLELTFFKQILTQQIPLTHLL